MNRGLLLAGGLSLGVSLLPAGDKILSDDFKAGHLEGWSLVASVPERAQHDFEGGALILWNQGMCRQALAATTPVPSQHKVTFEFWEGPDPELRWDLRYVRGLSRFDGLPCILYQLERDGRFGFWTRSEQGWISNVPGVPALGLREVIKDVQAGRWYRVLCQDDDIQTLVRIWSLPDEKVVYEKILRHDGAATIMGGESGGQVSFNLTSYRSGPGGPQLKIRNVTILGTGGRVSEELPHREAKPTEPAPTGEKQEVAVKVPSALEFEVRVTGPWFAGTPQWPLTHEDTPGTYGNPLHSPRLTVGGFPAYGLSKDTRYRVKVRFSDEKDFIRIEEVDTGRFFNEFVLAHKPVRETRFLLKDEKSRVEISRVIQTAGETAQAIAKTATPPNGYELAFEDDFTRGLGKWGAPRSTTCGFLRLDRFQHWAESGILEIPYLSASDFILEAEVIQTEGPHGFGLLCRRDADDDASFCMFKVNSRESSSFADRFSFDNGNKIPVAQETGTRLGGMLQPRRWHTVRVVADGERMAGYIDGVKCAEHVRRDLTQGGFALSVDVGTELFVRSFRVYSKKGSPFTYKPSARKETEPRLTAISEPFPLPPQAESGARVFKDALGRAHAWQVDQDALVYDGQRYRPVKDSDGQYFVRDEPDKWPASAYAALTEKDGATLERIRRHGLTWQIVPTQISTHIDCTREDSGFSEDSGLGGASRVLDLDGEKYRVTAARKSKGNYFLYRVAFPKPGSPYVMVYQVPNDRHRLTCICPLPPESGSAGVVTGGPFPVDHRSYNMMHLFFPAKESYEFCVYHREITKDWSRVAGGAVANLWLLLVEDDLARLAPRVDAKKGLPVRLIGTLDQTPEYPRTLYGVPARPADKLEKHQASMTRFADYVKFSGGNLVDFYFLGNDWALDTRVHYPSKLYQQVLQHPYDYVEQFLTVADKEGIATYPRIAMFTASEAYRAKVIVSTEALVVNKDGEYVPLFTNRIWNPLHPEVQKLYLDTVEELARAVAPHPSARGIAIDVGPGGSFLSAEVGYNRDTLQKFREETGIAVPSPDKGTPYAWMRQNCWDAWLDWRCRKLRDLYCEARDRVTAARPDLKLQLKFQIALWNGADRNTGATARQHLRETGIDLAMFHGTGIELACGLNYQDKYLHPSEDAVGVPLDSLLPSSPERKGLVDVISYYELPAVLPKISPRFVGWLATVNMTPVGRHVLELPTSDLRAGNATQMEFMRWEKGIAQMEALLRRFGAAFRSLPAVDATEFKGRIEVLGGKAADRTLVARWHADRLLVLNDDPESRKVRITLPQGLAGDEELRELGWNQVLAKGPRQDRTPVELDLQPFDLQVLAIEKARRGSDRSPNTP